MTRLSQPAVLDYTFLGIHVCKTGLAVKFVRVRIRVLFDVDIYKGYSNSSTTSLVLGAKALFYL